MIEKGRISAFQMALMMVPTIMATAILVIPAITGRFAGRDMWISPLLASLNGFFTVFIAYQLHRLYPTESIIQYSRHIIGQIPGKILGFVYLFVVLHTCGIIAREYTDFFMAAFFPKTPMIVIMGSMVLVCAFAVRGGVEVLGRVSQLLVPIFTVSPLLFLLLMPDLQLKNILPIMEHGVMPSIFGASTPMAWFSEVFLISTLLPLVTDHTKGRKWGMLSMLVVMVLSVFVNLIAVFLLGDTVTKRSYPVFLALKYVSIAGFFEHLESFVIMIWAMGLFIKISVFYYVLVLGTAQWLRLSDYRPIVLPLGLFVVLFGIWSSSDAQELTQFLGIIEPFYLLSTFTVLPMLLLLIAIIQKKLKTKSYTIRE